jgi:hypothetical protein
MNNVKNPIIFSLRYTKSAVEPLSDRTPLFRDIHVDHVVARGSINCCVIQGLEEQPIQDVTLKNLDLSGTNGVTCEFAKNVSFTNVKVAALQNLYVEEHAENVSKTDYHQVALPSAGNHSNHEESPKYGAGS